MSRIYLDAQSSTPIHPEVLESMQPFLTDQWALPGSAYQSAKMARKAIEKAREQVALCIGAASPEEILFTSSGTESNNLHRLPRLVESSIATEHYCTYTSILKLGVLANDFESQQLLLKLRSTRCM